ncbi:uncharacterized protein PV09_03023 [Verruconis gallopava]|uniref:SET domain-containing protein n=1 Tax=Verruconis gallopava TaxID=253628 RepID=A0A0D1YYN8_9PEZI|nr:uncharacterized protein PV09_03023 [Verruconis gallopava]KIW05817.1 hypothetical protein PV09_03023 [Verruconis gallopava]
MTELAPFNTHADLQLASSAPASAFAPSTTHPRVNGFSAPGDDVPEDDSIIRCFCDINEDDGSTVLCEICNTWSHIMCYYPDEIIPDTHVCVFCEPRPYDKKAALERQQHAKLVVSPAERKIKKVASKSHKKKVKDANSTPGQTNGWLSGADGPDRASGSPRDQGPPAKRPKTTHRSSASISNLASGHSRKRAGSTTMNGQSPTKSPRSNSPEGYSGDYYSPEFMRASNATFQTIEYNSYADLNIPNDLRTWLNDTDALKEISPNLTQKDVFTRWDRNIEALKQTSPGVSSCKREDPSIVINGLRPVYRWVTANAACSENAYIGELNGTIGRLESYIANPENRWKELRHPEPFVFFHDRLPVYVDCREEGSVLRHVGRSCNPNVKLQIIINGTDFHFCFISLREIAEGEELTVPWHIRDRELEIIRAVNDGGALSPEDEAHMSSWFTNVLANFGGCACSRLGPGVSCNLARFDLRNRERPFNSLGTGSKASKARKLKRLPAQISPGSTGRATNSRAGSEAVLHGDNDEDMADSRSMSVKSRSQPSSRDNTPMTTDATVGLGVAMSDRERRKLLQQEKLFEKMELDGGSGRKPKRTSGGPQANTPNPSNSKQLGPPDNPSPTMTSAASGTSRPPRTNGTSSRVVNGVSKATRRPKPEMISMPTQTEGDYPASSPSPRRRNTGSHISCLLRRVQLESKRRRERSIVVMGETDALTTATKTEASPIPSSTAMLPPPVPVSSEAPKTEPFVEERMDVDMQDAPSEADEQSKGQEPPPDSEPQKMDGIVAEKMDSTPAEREDPIPAEQIESMSTGQTDSATVEKSDSASSAKEDSAVASVQPSSGTPIQPPAPPWEEIQKASSDPEMPPVSRPTHVPIPPVPSFPSTTDPARQAPNSSTASTPADGEPQSVTATSFVQSPSSIPLANPMPALPSPSTSSSVVQPSPAKKKMSLGDWMKKRAQKEKDAKAEAESSAGPTNNVDTTDEIKSDPIEAHGETAEPRKDDDADLPADDVDMPMAPPSLVVAATATIPSAASDEPRPDNKENAEQLRQADSVETTSAPETTGANSTVSSST